jgi:hypothetical protein
VNDKKICFEITSSVNLSYLQKLITYVLTSGGSRQDQPLATHTVLAGITQAIKFFPRIHSQHQSLLLDHQAYAQRIALSTCISHSQR